MKKIITLVAAVLLLFLVAGCSNANEETPPTPEVNPIEVPSEPTPALAELKVSDLTEILAALNPSEATLTYYGKTGSSCDAGLAIRAESYIEKLQNFTWEEYDVSTGWHENDPYRCVLEAPGLTITAYRGSVAENTRLLRVETDDGVGRFVLPYLASEESEEAKQANWMIYETFFDWYYEALAATLYGGTGLALTEEELNWFADYTVSDLSYYDETRNLYIVSASEISCFFTSCYDDVRELDFSNWMWYFPGDGTAAPVTEAEFEALKNTEGFPFREVENLASMPSPIQKDSRSSVDAVLMQYAGITTADLDTSAVDYLPEYDAYYTYASDFGPGVFRPCYGERSGDTVTLWEIPNGENNTSDKLVLRKNGENWQILSHQPDTIS